MASLAPAHHLKRLQDHLKAAGELYVCVGRMGVSFAPCLCVVHLFYEASRLVIQGWWCPNGLIPLVTLGTKWRLKGDD